MPCLLPWVSCSEYWRSSSQFCGGLSGSRPAASNMSLRYQSIWIMPKTGTAQVCPSYS